MKKIVIIGGGASGLAAASTLNELKQIYQLEDTITLIEANDKLGKKILASGNGRCNLSHMNIISSDYHSSSSFHLEEILNQYSVQQFFDDKGLWTKNEGDLIYPNSKQAISVMNYFHHQLENINIQLSTKALSIDPIHKIVHTTQGTYAYDYLIIACGSKAAKALGGNESGYEMLKALHHTITPLQPALVQFRSKQVPKYLKGTRIRGNFLLIRNHQVIHLETGELLFTDYGLSGIAIFQLSRYYKPGDIVEVDVFPDESEAMLTKRIKSGLNHSNFDLEMILPVLYGKYLKDRLPEISYKNIKEVVNALKHHRFIIDGLNGFENAQIVQGGLSLEEVHEDLSSIYYPDIYIIGELLDIDGPCGGYNLHFAFSSGNFVANKIFEKLIGG